MTAIAVRTANNLRSSVFKPNFSFAGSPGGTNEAFPPSNASPSANTSTAHDTINRAYFGNSLSANLNLPGYSYNWIKQHLRKRITSLLTVVFEADISRSFYLETSVTGMINDNNRHVNHTVEAHVSGSKKQSIRQSRYSLVSNSKLSMTRHSTNKVS